MRFILVFSYLLILVFGNELPPGNRTISILNLQMNGYSPTKVDDYVAMSKSVEPGYIVAFEPLTKSDRVHHIIVHGCERPADQSGFWKGKQTCGKGASRILYAWARNAPILKLPDGVGISVGHSNDSISVIVMQVHYAQPFLGRVKDYSGVILHVTQEATPQLAAVYVFMSTETIPPKKEQHQSNISCFYRGNTPIHPFAFRTHTHSMGRVVSGFYKHNGNWTTIGAWNPQWPQKFLPIAVPPTITKGDLMAASCRFDSSDKSQPTNIGDMGSNEMCNFYMMYYWEAGKEEPFSEGDMCSEKEGLELTRDYPKEGTALLEGNWLLRDQGKQPSTPFGVQELYSLERIGSISLGEIGGLSFDHDTNLIIFHRGARVWSDRTFDAKNSLLDKTPIAEDVVLFVRFGEGEPRIIRSMGANQFFIPHGISYGADEFLFTTDAGSHTVAKWKIEQDNLVLVWELGERFVPGSDDKHFCQPTAVVRAGNNIYVADGGCNDRMLEFNLDGRKMNEYGSKPELYLKRPHDLVSTNVLALILADEGQKRVLRLSTTGGTFEEYAAKPYPNFTSAHDHGDYVYMISGDKTTAGEDIQVYVGRKTSAAFEFSFAPEGKPFGNPHILRLNQGGDTLFIGDNAGGKGNIRVFKILEGGAVPIPNETKGHPITGAVFQPSEYHVLSFISYLCVVFWVLSMGLLLLVPVFLILWICYKRNQKRKQRFSAFQLFQQDTEKFISSDDE